MEGDGGSGNASSVGDDSGESVELGCAVVVDAARERETCVYVVAEDVGRR